MAGEVKWVEGSTTTAISLAAALSNAANTYEGLTGCTHTAVDNSTTKYPDAKFVLNINDTFAAAPTAGGTIDVYMTAYDIDGTTDETPIPGASDILYLAKYVGSFIIDNQDVATIKPLIVRGCLFGIANAKFNLLNNCGQQISYTSVATTLKVTPLSLMPT